MQDKDFIRWGVDALKSLDADREPMKEEKERRARQEGSVVDLRTLAKNVDFVVVNDLHSKLAYLRLLLRRGLARKLMKGKACLILGGDVLHPAQQGVKGGREGFHRLSKDEQYRHMTDMQSSYLTLRLLFELKARFKTQVFCVVGNHDIPTLIRPPKPGDDKSEHVCQHTEFQKYLRKQAGEEGQSLFIQFMERCPILLIADGLVVAHGGPVRGKTLRRLAREGNGVVASLKEKDLSLEDISLEEVNAQTQLVLGMHRLFPGGGRKHKYTVEDVKKFLKALGCPEAIFLTGHDHDFDRQEVKGDLDYGVCGKGSFFAKVYENLHNHFIVFSGGDEKSWGYASVHKGIVSFINSRGKTVDTTEFYLPSSLPRKAQLRLSLIFNGMGDYKTFQRMGGRLWKVGIQRIQEVYDEAVCALKDRSETEGPFTDKTNGILRSQDDDRIRNWIFDVKMPGTEKESDYLFFKIALLIHSVAYYRYFLHWLDDENEERFRIVCVTGESLGIPVAAIVAGSISLGDYIRFARLVYETVYDKAEYMTPKPQYWPTVKGPEGFMEEAVETLLEKFPSLEIMKTGWPEHRAFRIDEVYAQEFKHFIETKYFPRLWISADRHGMSQPLSHSPRLEDVKASAFEKAQVDEKIKFKNPTPPIVSGHRKGILQTAEDVCSELLSVFVDPVYSEDMVRRITGCIKADVIVDMSPEPKALVYLMGNQVGPAVVNFDWQRTDRIIEFLNKCMPIDGSAGTKETQ